MRDHDVAGVGAVDDGAQVLARIQLRCLLSHHVREPLALDALKMDVLAHLQACLFLRTAGVANLLAEACAGVALGEGHPRMAPFHVCINKEMGCMRCVTRVNAHKGKCAVENLPTMSQRCLQVPKICLKTGRAVLIVNN